MENGELRIENVELRMEKGGTSRFVVFSILYSLFSMLHAPFSISLASPTRPPRFRAGVLAVLEHLHAVDKHVLHPTAY